MTAAGKTVELKRYRIPTGQRALQAQRIDGRVAVIDVPVDHDDRVYLVERHVPNQAELQGLRRSTPSAASSAGSPRSSRRSAPPTSSSTRSPEHEAETRAALRIGGRGAQLVGALGHPGDPARRRRARRRARLSTKPRPRLLYASVAAARSWSALSGSRAHRDRPRG